MRVGAVWGRPGWLLLLARPAARGARQLKRKKIKNSIAKAATSPSSGLAEVGAQPWALGMERDCRVTPEQGMPVSMEQRSHHSRAPGEHLHKKERHELLLESSRCCSLSPRSWQLHSMSDAMNSTELAAEEAQMPLQVIFCHCKCPQRVLAL